MMLGSANAVIEGVIDPYFTRFFNGFWRSLKDGSDAESAVMDGRDAANNDYVNRYFRIRGAGYLPWIYLTPNP